MLLLVQWVFLIYISMPIKVKKYLRGFRRIRMFCSARKNIMMTFSLIAALDASKHDFSVSSFLWHISKGKNPIRALVLWNLQHFFTAPKSSQRKHNHVKNVINAKQKLPIIHMKYTSFIIVSRHKNKLHAQPMTE